MKQNNKLSNPNKIKLYSYLCLLEDELKGTFGSYNDNSKQLVDFLEAEKIFLNSLTESNKKKCGQYKHFLLCNLRKPEIFKNITGNDKAYLYLKHIRNAIAHGNVMSINKLWFSIKDYSGQGTTTGEGKIQCGVFFRLIDELLRSRRNSIF